MLSFESFESPVPTGFSFHLKTYSGFRKPLLKWRNRCGWIAILEASHSFIEKPQIIITDEFGEQVPNWLANALSEMTTSLPYDPPVAEPIYELESAESLLHEKLASLVDSHYVRMSALMERKFIEERDSIEQKIELLSDEVHSALRACQRAMKIENSGVAFHSLQKKMQKLKQAENLIGKALKVGLADLRSQSNLEEIELLELADESIRLDRRATVFWQLR